ncbi:hypothetical protein ACHAW6_000934 [Cyclotella cf. meneghiniana]
MVDRNLWFCHALFGFPGTGTLNDINIWERSVLVESIYNGDHDKIDHDFSVDGQERCGMRFWCLEARALNIQLSNQPPPTRQYILCCHVYDLDAQHDGRSTTAEG